MALHLGSSLVSDIFLGTVRPSAVYLGTNLVWPTATVFDVIDGGAASPAWLDWYDAGSAASAPADVVSGGSSAS